MNYKFDRMPGSMEHGHEESGGIDFDQLLAAVRRQWRLVLVMMVIAGILGFAYTLTAVPIYSASASVLIDTNNQKIADELSSVTGVLQDDTSILSQVELLKSDQIASTVSEKLDLRHDSLFMAEHGGLIHNIVSSIKSVLALAGLTSDEALPPSEEQIQEGIIANLKQNLDVSRVGRTYVLQLDFSSASPTLAAKITQAYAEAYLTDQLDSKYDATRRASEWLQQRIAELRQKSLETDLAVQKFRAEKGLITTDGQLVSDQQLTQINTQLMLAQSDMASAEAKYGRIKHILDAKDLQSAVSESLESPVISELRTKYLDASRKEADISSRLGAQHTQAVRLRSEMSEYQRLMFEELGRIAQGYQSNLEVARARQKGLEAQVAQATGVSANADAAQVQLRELVRESETYKKLYETFLQRYQETVQQQSFPITEARIISKPVVPEKPSAPKKPLIVAIAMFLGLAVGSGLGAFREFRDRFFRTSEQIRATLDQEALGIVPLLKLASPERSRAAAKGAANPRVVSKADPLLDFVIESPLSAFAETMRSAKIAIDLISDKKKPKKIGITSILPGEGKSTISINFAELLASQGSRVLLIDADLRNPASTRYIGRHAEQGLIEVLQDNVAARDALMINPKTKLAFLPAVLKSRFPYSSELLSSEAMDRLIAEVSDVFDYIVFDLPPLAPVVDARAIAPKLDAYVLVVEWGKTSRSIVRKTLMDNTVLASKCAGVILNKVDPKKMRLYHRHGSSEFYSSQYSSYYQ
jgi:succinoglycan biosynthesis transport protein ExoP